VGINVKVVIFTKFQFLDRVIFTFIFSKNMTNVSVLMLCKSSSVKYDIGLSIFLRFIRLIMQVLLEGQNYLHICY
jgi:hypothetical protein